MRSWSLRICLLSLPFLSYKSFVATKASNNWRQQQWINLCGGVNSRIKARVTYCNELIEAKLVPGSDKEERKKLYTHQGPMENVTIFELRSLSSNDVCVLWKRCFTDFEALKLWNDRSDEWYFQNWRFDERYCSSIALFKRTKLEIDCSQRWADHTHLGLTS